MKLLLADDHTLFRDALVQYVERAEQGAHIDTAKDLDDTYKLLEVSQDYDLVLLDLKMPGMHGLKGFERIRNDFPDVRVGLMSGVAEPSDVRKAMDLGSVGYFPKTLSGKALLTSIQLVLTGERFLPIDHEKNTIQASYYSDEDESLGAAAEGVIKLTPREKEVLGFLVHGAANKEIARELDLQVVTVKLHVRGICRKLGAKNRTQAALIAQQLNVISS